MTLVELILSVPRDTLLKAADLLEVARTSGVGELGPARSTCPADRVKSLVKISRAERETGIPARTLRHHARNWFKMLTRGEHAPVFVTRTGPVEGSHWLMNIDELRVLEASLKTRQAHHKSEEGDRVTCQTSS
jgi:hypothetical protein